MNADRFKYKEITDIILRSFYETYNELGDGFLESVYENALYIVLTGYGLCVERQKDISVAPAHEAQLINYLKATNIEVGLLLNFGRKPESKRFVYDNKRKISVMISVDLWRNSYKADKESTRRKEYEQAFA
jgi:hypothetical protein